MTPAIQDEPQGAFEQDQGSLENGLGIRLHLAVLLCRVLSLSERICVLVSKLTATLFLWLKKKMFSCRHPVYSEDSIPAGNDF